MGNNNRQRQVEVPGARAALNHLKTEVAAELGVANYDQIDKGMLPSRLNGKVGGLMVRKMIEYAEQSMMQNPQAVAAVEAQPGANQQDIETAQQSLQAADAFLDQYGTAGTMANTGTAGNIGIAGMGLPNGGDGNQFGNGPSQLMH